MKNVRLNNGVMMPAIGFGIFQIPENETERIVNDAIETGYRKFDTAASYFNEEQLGNAIRHSGMKREEFFITTKLWVQDYEYDDALHAFDLSRKNRHKAQRKAKFYINKCRSASCMQGELKQASA